MAFIPDITLIGGGISGLLSARELRCAGMRVAILEKNRLGQEASWAGGGILLPIYPWRQAPAISDLVQHSLGLYPTLAAQLTTDTEIDPEWTQCGLFISQNPDLAEALAWCQRYGLVPASAAQEHLALLNTDLAQPLWLPDIAQVRNPRLLAALRQDVLNKGVAIYEHCTVTGWQCRNGRIQLLQTNNGDLAVNEVVITSGAWSGQWLPKIADGRDTIRPIKGQMLLFDAVPGVLPFMVLAGEHYLIPRRDGKILAGSTLEDTGFSKKLTALAHQELRDFALALLPALKDYPLICHWAGLRPGTAQGIPYITRHPDFANLSINAGHFRNGLVMGPAAAELLADLLLNRPPCLDPTPFQFTSAH